MKITLPWPDRRLSPNFHTKKWAVKWNAQTKANAAGFYCAREVYTPEGDGPYTDGLLRVTYHFFPPDRRHWDDDNIVTMLKHYRDGVANALAVNDNQFRMEKPVWHDPIKGGKIEMEIEMV